MFVVCKPLGQITFQKKHAVAGIALAWLWSLTWNLPPLFGWGRYELEGVRTSCAPDWHNRDPHNVSYILAYFAVCFAIPFTLILASYSKLVWTLHQVRCMPSQAVITFIYELYPGATVTFEHEHFSFKFIYTPLHSLQIYCTALKRTYETAVVTFHNKLI